MTGNPFAGLARIGWMEFWSHLKSPRLLILIVLFALLVFGASYGLSQTPSFTNYSYVYAHPAIRNESGVDHYYVVGWYADVRGTPVAGATLSLYEQTFNQTGPSDRRLLGNLTTNATGWVSADIGSVPADPTIYSLEPERTGGISMNPGSASFDPGLANRTFTWTGVSTSTTSGPAGSESIAYTHIVTLEGYPATEANVYLNTTPVGHPDPNGYVRVNLGPGLQTIKVSYQGYEESYPIYGGSAMGPTYENGVDVVLLTVTNFLGLLLPIAAIAISFDAIARERAQGSLEVLLAQRVRREGILTGKFLGAFIAVGIPVTVVLLAGVAVLAAVSGKTPTGSFVAVVVLGSLFLVAVYVLLMLILSTLAKSVGTAVVFGVVVWLFFNLFFTFLSFFVVMSSGGSLFDPATYRLLVTLQLFNPNTVFSMLVALAIPSTGGYSGLVPTGYVSASAVVAAATAWLAALFLLALLVFRKRAES